MRITVAFASTGRPVTLGEAISDLGRQSRPPDRTIISIAEPDDVDRDALARVPFPVDQVVGDKGLTRQRNAVLSALDAEEEIVLFLDDDFVMASDYLQQLERLFRDQPDICVATGDVLADGIGNGGITFDRARCLLAEAGTAPRVGDLHEVNNGYGCNVAFRCDPIHRYGLRFDESLPLYGWLEDIDFSRRVAAYGRCVRSLALRGVHLGIKGGRQNGLRLGYSQVANPVYLIRQATMRPSHALRLICRNIFANLAKSLRPEPWVDRRGRLQGNLLALGDLLRGRSDPMRVLKLDGRNDDRS